MTYDRNVQWLLQHSLLDIRERKMSANAYISGSWEEINRHAVASLGKLVPAHAPVDALKEAKVMPCAINVTCINAPNTGDPIDGPARHWLACRCAAQRLCYARRAAGAHCGCPTVL